MLREGGWTLASWEGGDWKVKREIVFPCPLTGHSWIHCWSSKGAHSGVRDANLSLAVLKTGSFHCNGWARSKFTFSYDPAKSSVTIIAWSDCASQQH